MNQTRQSITEGLPRVPGSYVLVLRLPESTLIQVGRLGTIGFTRGWYAYVGSALGPGGLAGRIGHHLRPAKRPHWHIDYLRASAEVKEIWVAVGTCSREHRWATVMADPPQAGRLMPGFGSTDCRCKSHLLYFDHRPNKDLVMKKLGADTLRLQPVPITTDPHSPTLA